MEDDEGGHEMEAAAAAAAALAAQMAGQQFPAPAPAYHVKLPPFWPTCPEAWFGLAEAQFGLRAVDDERLRYYLVLGVLPEATVRIVADLVAAIPPPDAYQQLKRRLISGHALTEFQRLEKLLLVQPLGAQRPTELLADMMQLCPVGEVGTRLFRMLFLSRLPRELRIILAEDGDSTLQDLAARANVLWSHGSGQQSSFAVAAVDADESSTVAAVSRTGGKGSAGVYRKGNAQPYRKSAEEKKKQLDSGFCFAHYRYGTQAYAHRCRQPCAWVAGN